MERLLVWPQLLSFCLTVLCLSCPGGAGKESTTDASASTATFVSPPVRAAQLDPGNVFFVSPTAGPGGKGTKKKPWDLQIALSQPNRINPGDTIYLLGGIYNGKFVSHLKGTAARPITVRSNPGEWAVIEGFVTTSLSGSVSSMQKGLNLADGSQFPDGAVVTVHDQFDPGSEEQMMLPNKSGNSYTNVQRGWNGTLSQAHSSGAMVILGGNQLFVDGSNAIYRDFEIRNSDPVRTQIPANTQNSPHQRGEGVFNVGVLNSFVNLVIHDCQEGIFNGDSGVGTMIYGCIIYNNGYVAGGAFNGHGLYVLHSDTVNTLQIKENIVFNNSNIGIKNDSQNGNAVNIWHEGDVSFNNGSWNQGGSRHWQLLAASNNGIAANITVKNCFFFVPQGIAGEQLRLGIGGQANGRADVTGNYTREEAIAAIDKDRILPDMLPFDPAKPAKYPNGRVFTDDVIDHRLAFLSKGDIPPDGLKPHTDILKEFPYIGTPHQTKS
jgi:hypothetical protein